MRAVDETPRPGAGKTYAQVYLRRVVTMLARLGGVSAWVEAGFHLPTYILEGDAEWLGFTTRSTISCILDVHSVFLSLLYSQQSWLMIAVPDGYV